MKRWITLLLALALLLTMAACGKKEPEVEEPEEPEVVEEETKKDKEKKGEKKEEKEEKKEEKEEKEEKPEEVVETSAPEEEVSLYPGRLPLGGESSSGQVIEIPEEGTLVYLGSKVVSDEYGDPTLLSYFDFTKTGDYEDAAWYCLTIYAYQGEEELWGTSYTYNDVVLDDSLYVEVEPGDSLEVCMAYNLENLFMPAVFSFNNPFEELEPIELMVDLSEVEFCLDIPEDAAGYYEVNYLYAAGNTWEYDMLVEYDMVNNSYVDLYADGSGMMSVAGDVVPLFYDMNYVYIGETELYYTLEDGLLTLEGDDLYYEFTYLDISEIMTEEEEIFVGETLTTDKGYVSITLDKGWYQGEARSNYALTLYHEDLDAAKWVEILDLQLTDLEHEMEYTHLALASAEYEEVTFGENTYQMLYSDTYGPQTYLVAETSTGKAFTVEVRSIPLEDVMTMLESIQIH